jgi:hypothetical protein
MILMARERNPPSHVLDDSFPAMRNGGAEIAKKSCDLM